MITRLTIKTLLKYFLVWILLLKTSSLMAQEVPFHRGVNLTGWFQASGARQIQFTKYTRQDFENIKSLGCDVVRLPINLHYMTNGPPDYTFDPLFFEFLDEVVNWTEALEMHLILDNHTFDPAADTDPNVGNILEKVWAQMAEHYKNRSELLYYEVLNEPHGISDEQWNAIQQKVVETIRAIDTKHYIVVGPANWNSFHNLDEMPQYNDDKLIYTFHFYDPFIFTHQGASWVTPSMEPLADVPFPYDAAQMPQLPNALKGSWIESAFNNYGNEGTIESVKALIDIAEQFKNARNVPVFCGEFGVYIPNSNNDDRVYWYEIVRQYLEEKNIPWTIWDYHGGFGLFEEGGNDLFEHDLNVSLLEALALNVPEQTEYVQKPDSIGSMIYSDYIGKQIFSSHYSGEGNVDFYDNAKPNNGKYCMYWTDATQYNTIGLDFVPNKDMSVLVAQDFALDFMVRGSAPATFDMRFLDTKTEASEDHPWRMRITIDENTIPFDSRWHHVHIPLKDFTEQGTWDNEWFPPEGKFDWTAIDRFEIVAENDDLKDVKLWVDNIHITDMDTAKVNDTTV
jgi:endoglucanase